MRTTVLSTLACFLLLAPQTPAQTLKIVAVPLPPLVIATDDGKPDGIIPRVLGELAENLGVAYSIELKPQLRALVESQGSGRVWFAGVTRNAEREHSYKWIGPIAYDSIVILTDKRDRKAPATLEDAKNWTVGVLRGGATVDVLKEAGFEDIFGVVDYESAMRMLESKRLDAVAVSKLCGMYIYNEAGFDSNNLDIGPFVRHNNVFIGVPLNVSEETIAQWQMELDKITACGSIEEITRLYATPNK